MSFHYDNGNQSHVLAARLASFPFLELRVFFKLISLALLSETMSACDPLRSPELEYIEDHDTSPTHVILVPPM